MHLRNFQLFCKTSYETLRLLHANLTTTNTRPQVSSFQCLWLRFTGDRHKGKVRSAFPWFTEQFKITLQSVSGGLVLYWRVVLKRDLSVRPHHQVTDAQCCPVSQHMWDTNHPYQFSVWCGTTTEPSLRWILDIWDSISEVSVCSLWVSQLKGSLSTPKEYCYNDICI